jgi:signal transduction histidine kinase
MRIYLLLFLFISPSFCFCQNNRCEDDIAVFEKKQFDFTDAAQLAEELKVYAIKNINSLSPNCYRRIYSLLANFYHTGGSIDTAELYFKKELYYGSLCKDDTSEIGASIDYARFLNSRNPERFFKYIDTVYRKLFKACNKYDYSAFLGSNAAVTDTFTVLNIDIEKMSGGIIADMPNYFKDLWRQYYAVFGSALVFSTKPKLAEKYMQLALYFDRNEPSSDAESITLNNLGLLYQNEGNHAKAVESFLAALNKNDEGNEEYAKINTLGNISFSYRMIKQYSRAKKYTEQAMTLAKKLNLSTNLCRALSAHASIFIEEGNYTEAEKYLRQSIELSHSIGNKADLCYSMRKLGNMLIGFTPRLQEGKHYADSSRYYANEIGDAGFMYYIDFTDANYYFKTGAYPKALPLAQLSLQQSIDYNDKEITLVSLELLSKVHEKLNNPAKALEYFKKYQAIKDNVIGKDMQIALSELQEKYDSQQNEATIQKLEKQKKERAQQTKILLGTLGALLLLSGFFFYFNRKLSTQKKQLQASNQSLAEISASQNRLFGIISHDLKGMVVPFHRAGKILSNYIDKNNLLDAKLFSSKLEENAGRLSATLNNLLFWSLQQMKGLKINKEPLPVYETINHVVSHYTELIQVKDITIHNEVQQADIFLTDKEAFQVIIRNLLSNAVKFTENSSITFSAANTQDTYIVTVTDKGIGMDKTQIEKLFYFNDKKSGAGTRGEGGSGLGLVVVNKMAAVLNGDVQIKSSPGNGTSISITFKKTA